ncbi:MAG: glucosamine-6-phosphate deaminase [Ruminococcaceae bacterium]|nr:glucosamine-6-phosphate deaminase [Oscillospiraceae bacterium]
MKIIVCEDYDEVSLRASEIISKGIKEKKDIKLGLATGSTPQGVYQNLIKMFKRGELDFSSVSAYNLDEYYPIRKDDNQSYAYFMKDKLFSHINIKPENIHIPSGEAKEPAKECEKYDSALECAGGVDIQILGLGINGHIGFNEPADELIANTHLTPLTESTINANSRFFESIDDVPKFAITMGVGSILSAKSILLLVTGKNKHKALMATLKGTLSTSTPASVLALHKNVTVICDKEAYYGDAV